MDHCTFLPEMNISHWFSDFLVIGDRWPIKDSNLNIWSQKNFRQLPSVGCCFGKSSLGLWRTTTDEMFCFFLRNTNNIVLWNRDDVECRPRIPLFWAQNDSKLGCETKTMRVRTRAPIYFLNGWVSALTIWCHECHSRHSGGRIADCHANVNVELEKGLVSGGLHLRDTNLQLVKINR